MSACWAAARRVWMSRSVTMLSAPPAASMRAARAVSRRCRVAPDRGVDVGGVLAELVAVGAVGGGQVGVAGARRRLIWAAEWSSSARCISAVCSALTQSAWAWARSCWW